jgi:hypothetical protein
MYYIAEYLKYLDSKTSSIRRDMCDIIIIGIGSLMTYLKSS